MPLITQVAAYVQVVNRDAHSNTGKEQSKRPQECVRMVCMSPASYAVFYVTSFISHCERALQFRFLICDTCLHRALICKEKESNPRPCTHSRKVLTTALQEHYWLQRMFPKSKKIQCIRNILVFANVSLLVFYFILLPTKFIHVKIRCYIQYRDFKLLFIDGEG